MNHRGKVGNVKQLGGIETSVLDAGAAAGVRIAWVDTGTGFRFKVVLDRGMDIADAWYKDCNLAWLSQVGIVKPQLLANSGLNWLRTFAGGLLTTCGLDHVGGPEEDGGESRGIHGQLSNLPATLLQVQQPDAIQDQALMLLKGELRQQKIFGPNLKMTRTISARLGEAAFTIEDEIVNEGNTEVPWMLLYHFNFGYPLLDAGTQIHWEGEHSIPSDPKFLTNPDIKLVPEPLEAHRGSGESVIFIDVAADAQHRSTCALWNPHLGFGVRLEWDKRQLPWLTNWQHFAPHEFVTGLEPGTHPPIGQKKARETGSLGYLKPLERKKIELKLSIITAI